MELSELGWLSPTFQTDMISYKRRIGDRYDFQKYPKEMKDEVVARILSGEETKTDVNCETRININTLYKWIYAAEQTG